MKIIQAVFPHSYKYNQKVVETEISLGYQATTTVEILVQILTKAANYAEDCLPHILFPNNVKDKKLI